MNALLLRPVWVSVLFVAKTIITKNDFRFYGIPFPYLEIGLLMLSLPSDRRLKQKKILNYN